MLVSGETGSPLVNQPIQMGDDIMTDDGDAMPTLVTYTDQTNMEQSHGNLQRAEDVQVKLEALCNMDSLTDNDTSTDDQRPPDVEPYDTTPPMFHQSGIRGPPRLYPMAQSPKLYQCALCQKSFRSIQILQMHSQTFHQRVSGNFSQSRSLMRNRNRNSRKSKPGQEERR